MLIRAYAQRIVEDESTGVVNMLKENMKKDLHLLYVLFLKEPDTLKAVREKMKMVRAYTCIVYEYTGSQDPVFVYPRTWKIHEHRILISRVRVFVISLV